MTQGYRALNGRPAGAIYNGTNAASMYGLDIGRGRSFSTLPSSSAQEAPSTDIADDEAAISQGVTVAAFWLM